MKRNGFFAGAKARTAVSPAAPRIDRAGGRETTRRLSCELGWAVGIDKQPAPPRQVLILLAVAPVDAHGEFEAQ
jgi:hypothetical protein